MKNYVSTLSSTCIALSSYPEQILFTKRSAISRILQLACLFKLFIFSTACSAQTSTWEGVYSSDWFNSNNWENNQIPDAFTDVIIPIAPHFPTIDETVTVKSILIQTSCELLIEDIGNLNVLGNASLDYGIKNKGTVTNIGLIVCNINAPGTGYGIINEGTFETKNEGNFQSTSETEIHNSSGTGLWNKSGATFTNGADMQIGNAFPMGGIGIINEGTFDNLLINASEYQGEISILNTASGAIKNQGGTFNNDAAHIIIDQQESSCIANLSGGEFKNINNGNIDIGLNSSNIFAVGILNDASDFTNEGASITIKEIGGGAIENTDGSTFSNTSSGQILMEDLQGAGILNDASDFTNEGASITIEGATGVGIKNTSGSTFENTLSGQIVIDDLSATAVTAGNAATFTNSGGSTITIGPNDAVNKGIVLSDATFTNTGSTVVTNNIKNRTLTVESGSHFQNLGGGLVDINGHHADADGGDAQAIFLTSSGSTFTNDGSTVEIDGIGGLFNFAIHLNSGTTFKSINNSQVLVGQDAAYSKKSYYGLLMEGGTFLNSSSLLKLDKIKNTGIDIDDFGNFNNYAAAEVYICQNSNLSNHSISLHYSTFRNNDCSLVWFASKGIQDLHQPFGNNDGFRNNATVIDNTSDDSDIARNDSYYFNFDGGTVTIDEGSNQSATPMTSSSSLQIWTGCSSTNTDWATATNWVSREVPTASSAVVILPNDYNPVIASSPNAFAESIYIESGAELKVNSGGHLQVIGSDSVGIRNRGDLTIGGTVDISNSTDEGLYNQHYIKVQPTGLLKVHDIVASDGCNCGGTLDLQGTAKFYNISGDAVSLIGNLNLISSGRLNIYDSNGFGITCWPSSADVVNGGIIRIYNLDADAISIESGTFLNKRKLLIGEDGGTENIGNSGIFVTGYFENDTDGQINIENVVKDGIANFYGTLLNKGTINIDNAGRYGIYNTGTTTNESGGDIHIGLSGGSGNIGSKGLNLTANSFINEGTLSITEAVQYAIDNSATFSNTGMMNGTGNINGGGSSLAGTLAPGMSPGTMSFTSDQVFETTNTLQIEVDGTTSGTDHDQVVVNGTVSISGTLSASFNYTPSSNDRIVFLTATTVSGTFGTVSPALPANWELDYTVPGEVALLFGANLPVELVSFSARAQNKNVMLTWQTATEINNQGFEVEHSFDGQEWTSLRFVEGHGTSIDKHDYSFLHENPSPGMNYYRLRQMDFDGQFEYSDIRSVEMSGGSVAINVFPNPTSSHANIQLPDNYEQAHVQLFDAGGRLIVEEAIAAGETFHRMDLSAYRSGFYLLKMQINGRSWNHKLQIHKD